MEILIELSAEEMDIIKRYYKAFHQREVNEYEIRQDVFLLIHVLNIGKMEDRLNKLDQVHAAGIAAAN